MPDRGKPTESKPFSDVLKEELENVRKRRAHMASARAIAVAPVGERRGEVAAVGPVATVGVDQADKPEDGPASDASQAVREIDEEKKQRLDALSLHLSGLAISGGGIRSATIAFGLLQGLADLKLIRCFDYISSVSGGGYIASFLAAWTKREGDPDNVYTQLRPNRDVESGARRPPLPNGVVVDEEPEPIRHLRSYSNYLTPRVGFLTPDTWSLLAIYARNLLINFLILLPATMFVVLLVRLALFLFRAPNSDFAGTETLEWNLVFFLGLLFLVMLSVVFSVIGMELYKMQEARQRKKALDLSQAQSSSDKEIKKVARRWLVAVVVLFFVMLGAVRWQFPAFAADLQRRPWGWSLLVMILGIAVVNGLIFLLARYFGFPRFISVKKNKDSMEPIAIYWLLWLVVAPLIACAVLCTWLFSIDPSSPADDQAVKDGVIVTRQPPDSVLTAKNFKTRVEPLGYRVLIPPYNPPGIFSGQSPEPTLVGAASVDEAYNEAALTGWKEGKLFLWPALVPTVFFALMHGLAHLFINWNLLFFLLLDPATVPMSRPFSPQRWKMCATLSLAPFISGALGGFLFYVSVTKVLWTWHHQPHLLVTFGPPLFLLIFTVCAALEIGLLGRRLEEDEREWWSRLGALVLLGATLWLLLFGAVLFAPWLFALAGANWHPLWVKSGLTFGWLATSIGGALAGRSSSTGGRDRNKWAELLAQVAPWVFLLGLLAAVSGLVGHFVNEPPKDLPDDHWAAVALAGYPTLLGWITGVGVFTWLMLGLIDVNLFSLNNMYANRLIRCYLGASRRKKAWRNRWVDNHRPVDRCGAPTDAKGDDRSENPISGFDFDDDIPLSELRAGLESEDLGLPAYWGPLPLINTALNLVATRELDWQERKAESFVLTPYYCGSDSTGYQRLPDDFRRGNLTLGKAVAVSGAAADPNMGRHTSVPVMALMTVFNTRLGWWVENPAQPRAPQGVPSDRPWGAISPSFGGLILKELTGDTDSSGSWVHLSDGGHFENLAAYELIRRRCRYVVICDNGCDPDFLFEDLAGLIRKCRIDFGIRIEIDTSPVRKQAGTGLSQWHCAIGKIRYDDVDGGETPGMLVYIKSSLTGDEPTDVQQFARFDPAFPHQTTADQFFDETQFESYRALGYHLAKEVFGDVLEDPTAVDAEDIKRVNQRIFSSLRGRWSPAPPELNVSFREVSEAYDRLLKSLRADPNLIALTYDLYPELGPLPDAAAPDPAKRAAAELHAVTELFLLMQKVWMAVKLEGYPEHPMNRGWMNQLRRTSVSGAIQKYWHILRGGFSQEFVHFCERELLLHDAEPVFENGGDFDDDMKKAMEGLRDEFDREWPGQADLLTKRIGPPESPNYECCGLRLIWNKAASFAYGFVLECPCERSAKNHQSQVMVWIRPAYRNLGIGRHCFQKLFPVDSASNLRVRYPKVPRIGEGIRVDLWKYFHFTQGFRPAAETDDFIILERGPRQ